MDLPLPPTSELIWPVFVPGTIATVTLVAAWRPWQRGEHAERGEAAAWAFPVLAGLAFIVAFLSKEWPRNAPPFTSRWHDIVLVAAGLLLTGMIASTIRSAVGSLLVSAIGVAAAMSQLDLSAIGPELPRWVPVAVAVALVLAMEPLAARRPGFAMPAIFWMAFTAASMTIVMSAFAKLSLVAASLSAVSGAAIVVGAIQPRFRLARGGITVLAPLLVVVLATGAAYDQAGIGIWPWILVLLVPVLGWMGEVPLGDSVKAGSPEAPAVLKPRVRIVSEGVRLLLPLLAMVAAIFVAGLAASGDEETGEEYDTSIYGG